jgi:hypothetical protein
MTIDTEAMLLPTPSKKECVSVYLRVKPKMPEESELDTAVGTEDENFEVVTITSNHQVSHLA